MIFENKFRLGDNVSILKYDITNAIITGIQAHFNGSNTKITSYDYDILYNEDGINYIDHYAEDHLEFI